MNLEEQVDKSLYKLRLIALQKAAIVLETIGGGMNHQAKSECEVLAESVRWAEKELQGRELT